VKISARAGTGKTATLLMLAKELRSSRKSDLERASILYLVYNARASKEASPRFKGLARVSTIHSFALGSIPEDGALRERIKKAQKEKERLPDCDAGFFLDDFKDLKRGKHKQAALCAGFLAFFLNSTHATRDAAAEAYGDPSKKLLPGDLCRDFNRHLDKTVAVIKRHMGAWVHGRELCPHDFYLKYSQKNPERWLLASLEQYNTLLVDEGQDLSPVMLDAVEQFPGRVFVVGDTHQQIYAFRHATDAMLHYEADAAFELPVSFRFGAPVAQFATDFIRAVKQDSHFLVSGNPKVTSSLQFYEGNPRPGLLGAAVLARTHGGLFDAAVTMLDVGAQFVFFGEGTKGFLQRTRDVYSLSCGAHTEIRDPFIRSFTSLAELGEHAEAVGDRFLAQIMKNVSKYGTRIPSLLAKLNSGREVGGIEDVPQDAVVLATVHGVKGLEFPEVWLCEDIAWKLHNARTEHPEAVNEEANITYVALTRAQYRLHLPLSLKAELSLGHRQAEPQLRADSRRPPKLILPKGQRVYTMAYGHGTVLDSSTDGLKRLVQFDAHRAQLWMHVGLLRQL
jgi:superfamily I DNA/RNA helicase